MGNFTQKQSRITVSLCTYTFAQKLNIQVMTDKEQFIHALSSTGRRGVESVLANLNALGFFTAPASSVFHLNGPGGLLTHSLNVYKEAMAIREKQAELCPEVMELIPADSVAIAALLHDVCKADIYKEAVKSRKLEDGSWEKYAGYDVDYSSFPLGHGEKSVIQLLRWGLEMTDAEICAIRWHMGPWDLAFQSPESKSNISTAKGQYPLISLITAADGLASFLMERKQ